MESVAVITGAGFSHESGVPLTTMLGKQFLKRPERSRLDSQVDQAITDVLQRFWTTVFAVSDLRSPPSFEDHFTLLDLPANAGHNMGTEYPPAKLRAVRRLSIDRVFRILDQFRHNNAVEDFLLTLAEGRNNVIVSTNWDVATEKYLLDRGFSYGDAFRSHGTAKSRSPRGVPVLKLHGSSNWLYCDSCQQSFVGPRESGKTTWRRFAFLEDRDFDILGAAKEVIDIVKTYQNERLLCDHCDIPLGARVGTFSYSKALNFPQFHEIWAAALERLRKAKTWIFVGYSFPESDFHVRHMLKRAQLAGGRPGPVNIHVVTKGKEAVPRYRRFFGHYVKTVSVNGFMIWWSNSRGKGAFA